MKRCPTCDFLYEDDQSLCDMDGRKLVFEAAPLRLKQNVATSATSPKRKLGWRLFGILAIPTFVLGLLVPVAFQQSRQANIVQSPEAFSKDLSKSASQNANQTGAPEMVNQPGVSGPVLPTPSATPSPSPEDTPVEATPSPRGKTSTLNAREAEKSRLASIAIANANSVARENAKSIGRARADAGGIQLVVVSSGRSGAFATQPVVARNREEKKAPTDVKPREDNERKGSQIVSFLKKTGRILKKPFKS